MTRRSRWISAGFPSATRRAGVEHRDLIGDAHDQRHVVLDHDDGDRAVADGHQQSGEFGGFAVVEPRRRFVEEQHARARHQRPHDLERLLRAHRQIDGGRIAKLRQSDEIEKGFGALRQARSSRRAAGSQSICAGARARTCICAPDHDVFERGHARKDARRSGTCARVPAARSRRRRDRRDRCPKKRIVPDGGREQVGDQR